MEGGPWGGGGRRSTEQPGPVLCILRQPLLRSCVPDSNGGTLQGAQASSSWTLWRAWASAPLSTRPWEGPARPTGGTAGGPWIRRKRLTRRAWSRRTSLQGTSCTRCTFHSRRPAACSSTQASRTLPRSANSRQAQAQAAALGATSPAANSAHRGGHRSCLPTVCHPLRAQRRVAWYSSFKHICYQPFSG